VVCSPIICNTPNVSQQDGLVLSTPQYEVYSKGNAFLDFTASLASISLSVAGKVPIRQIPVSNMERALVLMASSQLSATSSRVHRYSGERQAT
jgi:hypothetical protein